MDTPVAPPTNGPAALTFDSRFESGNLRQAIQIYSRVYDLVTSPDINSVGHTQWFNFGIAGMEAGKKYTFNIVNLEKTNSQYNFGMQPVMFSTKANAKAKVGSGWHRDTRAEARRAGGEARHR